MLHSQRIWFINPIADPDWLADQLCNHTSVGCQALSLTATCMRMTQRPVTALRSMQYSGRLRTVSSSKSKASHSRGAA